MLFRSPKTMALATQHVGGFKALAAVIPHETMTFSAAITMVIAMNLGSIIVPASRMTEGLTWMSTGISIGVALGSVLAGLVIDAYGAAAGFGVGIGAGLFNDRLDLALRAANRRKSTLALLFVDMNDFKGINDIYGHAMGDRVM